MLRHCLHNLVRTLTLALALACITEDARGQIKVDGSGKSEGLGGYRGPRPDPADARVFPVDEFRAKQPEERRKILAAWNVARLETATPPLFAMLEVALKDTDQAQQLSAVRVLGRFATAANIARLNKKTVTSDPQSYPALYGSALPLLDHRDAGVRREVLSLLTIYYVPPRADLEDAVVGRIKNEQAGPVRAAMVTALAQRARGGSLRAKQYVLDLLKNGDTASRVAAINSIRYLQFDEALPHLIQSMTSPDRLIRLASATALSGYKAIPAEHAATLNKALAEESDQAVKKQLTAVLGKLESKGGRLQRRE